MLPLWPKLPLLRLLLLLLLLLTFSPLDHFPEPFPLLVRRQDGRVRHSGDPATFQPAFLALPTVLDRHDAVAALFADETLRRVVLWSADLIKLFSSTTIRQNKLERFVPEKLFSLAFY
jgi:hypothetical protein